ncbi:MAG TPA: DUF4157 domain-containing protein [Gemmatimonadales bacterium]
MGELTRALDCSRVRIHSVESDGAAKLLRRLVLWLSRGRAVALGNHIFLPHRSDGDLPVLAHELTHCAQYQEWGAARYYARGVGEQMRYLVHRLLGVGSSPYSYTVDEGRPFESYGMEQQGQIVEDCFRSDVTAAARRSYKL